MENIDKNIHQLGHLSNKDTETSHNFGLGIFNGNTGTTLMVYGQNDTSKGYNQVAMYVYDTKIPKSPLNAISKVHLANPDLEVLKPIAVASICNSTNNMVVESIYVGKSYRRKGIGTMLMNICEDIAYACNAKTLYASQYFSNENAEEVNYIRSHTHKIPFAKQLIEKITNSNSGEARSKATNKFLSSCGFETINDPYYFSRKYNIESTGYIFNPDKNSQFSQFYDNVGVRLNTTSFVKSLNKKENQSENNSGEIEKQ